MRKGSVKQSQSRLHEVLVESKSAVYPQSLSHCERRGIGIGEGSILKGAYDVHGSLSQAEQVAVRARSSKRENEYAAIDPVDE